MFKKILCWLLIFQHLNVYALHGASGDLKISFEHQEKTSHYILRVLKERDNQPDEKIYIHAYEKDKYTSKFDSVERYKQEERFDCLGKNGLKLNFDKEYKKLILESKQISNPFILHLDINGKIQLLGMNRLKEKEIMDIPLNIKTFGDIEINKGLKATRLLLEGRSINFIKGTRSYVDDLTLSAIGEKSKIITHSSSRLTIGKEAHVMHGHFENQGRIEGTAGSQLNLHENDFTNKYIAQTLISKNKKEENKKEENKKENRCDDQFHTKIYWEGKFSILNAGKFINESIIAPKGAVWEKNGFVNAQKDASLLIEAQSFINTRHIFATQALGIKSRENFSNKGTMEGKKGVFLDIANDLINEDRIESQDLLEICVGKNLYNKRGALLRGKDADIKVNGLIQNEGEMTFLSLSLITSKLENWNKIFVEKEGYIQAFSKEEKGFLNSKNARILSHGTLMIDSHWLENERQGKIKAKRLGILSSQEIINDGILKAKEKGEINTTYLQNRQEGTLIFGKQGAIQATRWDNEGKADAGEFLFIDSVEVNNSGDVSSQGTLVGVIDWLDNRTRIFARNILKLTLQTFENLGRMITTHLMDLHILKMGHNEGDLEAGNHLHVTAQKLENTEDGIIKSGNTLSVYMKGQEEDDFNNSGLFIGKKLTLDIQNGKNIGPINEEIDFKNPNKLKGLLASESFDLTVHQSFRNKGHMYSGGAFSQKGLGKIEYELEGKAEFKGAFTSSASTVNNSGLITSNENITFGEGTQNFTNDGTIETTKTLEINSENLTNTHILKGNEFKATLSKKMTNSGAVTGTEKVDVTVPSLENTGQLSGKTTTLDISSLLKNSEEGNISAVQSLILKGKGILQNEVHSKINSEGTLTSSMLTVNNTGSMMAVENLTFVEGTENITSDGTIKSEEKLDINSQVLKNTKDIEGKNTTIKVSDVDNSGKLSSKEILAIEGDKLTNTGKIGGQIVTATLTGDVTNKGTFKGTESATVKASTITNEGEISSKFLTLDIGTFLENAKDAFVSAVESLTLKGTGKLENKEGGVVRSEGIATSSLSDVNNQGNFTTEGDLTFENLTTGLTNGGKLESKTKLDFKGLGILKNEANGTINSEGTLTSSMPTVNNTGLMTAVGNLTFEKGTKNITNDGTIKSDELIEINGQVFKNTKDIEGKNTTVKVLDVDNSGKLFSKEVLAIEGDKLTNTGKVEGQTVTANFSEKMINSGTVTGNEKTNITTPTLENIGQLVGKTITLDVSKLLKNSGKGSISAGQTLILKGLGTLENKAQSKIKSTGTFTSFLPTINNIGTLRSNQTLTFAEGTKDISNSGAINSKKAIDFKGETLTNTGKIKGSVLTVTLGKNLINRGTMTWVEKATIETDSFENRWHFKGGKELELKGRIFTNTGNIESETIQVTFMEKLINSGVLQGVEKTDITAPTLENTGQLSGKTTTLDVSTLLKNSGKGNIFSSQTLTLKGLGTLENEAESEMKSTGKLISSLPTVNNSGSMKADQDLTFGKGTQDIANSGIIHSDKTVHFEGITLDNKGKVFGDTLKVEGPEKTLQEKFINTGIFHGFQSVDVKANYVENEDEISSNGLLTFEVGTFFKNTSEALASSFGNLTIKGDGEVKNTGVIKSQEKIDVHSLNVFNQGEIISDIIVEICTKKTGKKNKDHDFKNEGLILSPDIIIKANEGSSSGNINEEIDFNSVDHLNGLIAENSLTITADKTFTNNAHMFGGKVIHLSGPGMFTNEKCLDSEGTLNSHISHFKNKGLIETAEGVHFEGKTLDNKGGIYSKILKVKGSEENKSQDTFTNSGTFHGSQEVDIKASHTENKDEGEISSEGTLTLEANTLFENKDKALVSSKKDLTIKGNGDVKNEGKIKSQEKINVQSPQTFNQGLIEANKEISFEGKTFDNKGEVYSESLKIKGSEENKPQDKFTNSGTFHGSQSVDIKASHTQNSKEISSEGTLTFKANKLFENKDKALVSSKGDLTIKGNGKVQNKGTMESQEKIEVQSSKTHNEGKIVSNKEVKIHTQETKENLEGENKEKDFENTGLILSSDIIIDTNEGLSTGKVNEEIDFSAFDNLNGLIAENSLKVTTHKTFTNNGHMFGGTLVNLLGSGTFTNDIRLDSNGVLNSQVNHFTNNGNIETSERAHFEGKTLDNKGGIYSKILKVKGSEENKLQDTFTNSGTFHGSQEVDIKASHTENKDEGEISSEGTLTLEANNLFENKDKALVSSIKDLILKGDGDVKNDGNIKSQEKIDVQSPQVLNQGIIESDKNVNFIGKSVDNKGTVLGTTLKVESLEKKQQDTFTNSGIFHGSQEVEIKASHTENKDEGEISSEGTLTFEFDNSLKNLEKSLVFSKKDLTISTIKETGEVHNKGTFESQGTISIPNSKLLINDGIMQGHTTSITTSSEFKNFGTISATTGPATFKIQEGDNQGTLYGKEKVDMSFEKSFTNKNLISSSNIVSLHGDGKLANKEAGILGGDQQLEIKEVQLENEGILRSLKEVSLHHLQGTLENKSSGKILSMGKISVKDTETFHNAGQMQGNEGVTLTVPNLENENEISSTEGKVDINNTKSLINNGTIQGHSASVTTASKFENHGTISATTGSAIFDIQQGGENDGTLYGKEKIDLKLGKTFTNKKLISSSKIVSLYGDGKLENKEAGILGGNQQLEIKNVQLDNEGILRSLKEVTLHDLKGTLENKSSGKILSQGKISVKKTETFHNAGQMQGNEEVTLTVPNLQNKNEISSAEGVVDIAVTTGSNEIGGIILGKKSLTVDTKNTFTNTGTMESEELLTLKGQGAFTNDNHISSGAQLDISDLSTFKNTEKALLFSKTDLTIQGTGDVQNEGQIKSLEKIDIKIKKAFNQGKMTSNKEVKIHNQEIKENLERENKTKDFENTGLILSHDIIIEANEGSSSGKINEKIDFNAFDNLNGLIAEKSLKLKTNKTFTNNGHMFGGTGVDLSGSGTFTNDNRLESDGTLNSQLSHLENKGTVLAKSGTLDGKSFHNDGQMHFQDKSTLNFKDIQQTTKKSVLSSTKDLTIEFDTLGNQGVIGANEEVKFEGKSLDNKGEVYSKILTVEGSEKNKPQDKFTNSGTFHGSQKVDIKASHTENKDEGEISSEGTLTFETNKLFKNAKNALVSSLGEITVNGKGDVQNEGVIKSQKKIEINSSKTHNKGKVASNENIVIHSQDIKSNQSEKEKPKDFENEGLLISSKIKITSHNGSNTGLFKDEVDVRQIDNNLKGLLASESLDITVGNHFVNNGEMMGGTTVTLTGGGTFENEKDGDIHKSNVIKSDLKGFNNKGIMRAYKSIALNKLTQELNNSGLLLSEGSLEVNSKSKLINKGFIEGREGNTTLTTHELENHGLMSSLGGKLKLTTIKGNNSNLMFGQGGVDLTIRESFLNQGTGNLESMGSININGPGTLGNHGSIKSKEKVITDTKSLINNGTLQGQTTSITTSSEFKNQGTISATTGTATFDIQGGENDGTLYGKDKVDLKLGKTFTNKSLISSPKIVSLQGVGKLEKILENKSSGKILSLGTVNVKDTETFHNSGEMKGNEGVTVTTSNLQNEKEISSAEGTVDITVTTGSNEKGGKIVGKKAVTLETKDTFTNTGTMESEEFLSLKGKGSFTNNNHISSGEKLDISDLSTFKNTEKALLSSLTDLTIQKTGDVQNEGHIKSQGKIDINTEKALNQGKMISNKVIEIHTQEIKGNQKDFNNTGLILGSNIIIEANEGSSSGKTNKKIDFNAFDNLSGLIAENTLKVTTHKTFTNNSHMFGGTLVDLSGSGTFTNDNRLNSNDSVNSQISHFHNNIQGNIKANKNINFIGETVDNKGSVLGGTLTVEGLEKKQQDKLTNTGIFHGSQSVDIKASHTENKDEGEISSEGPLTFEVGTLFENKDKALVSSKNDLTIKGNSNIKNDGNIESNKDINFIGKTVDNKGTVLGENLIVENPQKKQQDNFTNTGIFHGSQGVDIKASQVKNEKEVSSEGLLTFEVDTLFENTKSSLLSSKNNLTVKGGGKIQNDGNVESQENINITNTNLLVNNGTIKGQKTSLTTTSEFKNQGTIAATTGTASFHIQSGENNGTLQGKEKVDLTLEKTFVNNKLISSPNIVSLQGGGTLENKTSGQILSEGTVSVKDVSTFHNSGQMQGNKGATVTTANLQNENEISSSEGTVNLDVTTGSNGKGGKILGKKSLKVNTKNTFTNTGTMEGDELLSLTGGTFTNDNLLQGKGSFTTNLSTLMNNKDIKAGTATLGANDLQNTQDILVENGLQLNVQKGSNQGIIQSKTFTLNLTSEKDQFANKDILRAKESMKLQGTGTLSNQKNIVSDGTLILGNTKIINDPGAQILSQSNININQNTTIENKSKGLISSLGQITFEPDALKNEGDIEAKGNIDLKNVKTLTTSEGSSLFSQTGKVDLPQLTSLNNGGNIVSQEPLILPGLPKSSLSSFKNPGSLKSHKHLLITTSMPECVNENMLAGREGVLLSSTGNTTIKNQGPMVSEKVVGITAARIHNSHMILGNKGVNLNGTESVTLEGNSCLESSEGKITLKKAILKGTILGDEIELHSSEKISQNTLAVTPVKSLILYAPKGWELNNPQSFLHNLEIHGPIFLTAGHLKIMGNFKWNAPSGINNTFDILSEGFLTLNFKGKWTNSAQVEGKKGSDIKVHSFINQGTFYSYEKTNFDCLNGEFDNHKQIEVHGPWTLNALKGSIKNHPGAELYQKNISNAQNIVIFKAGQQVSNTSGTVSLQGHVDIQTSVFLNDVVPPIRSEPRLQKIALKGGHNSDTTGYLAFSEEIPSKSATFYAGSAKINANEFQNIGSTFSTGGDFYFEVNKLKNFTKSYKEYGQKIVGIRKDGKYWEEMRNYTNYNPVVAKLHSRGSMHLKIAGTIYTGFIPQNQEVDPQQHKPVKRIPRQRGVIQQQPKTYPGVENSGSIVANTLDITGGILKNGPKVSTQTQQKIPQFEDVSKYFESKNLQGPSFWKQDSQKETGFQVIQNKPVHLVSENEINLQLNKRTIPLPSTTTEKQGILSQDTSGTLNNPLALPKPVMGQKVSAENWDTPTSSTVENKPLFSQNQELEILAEKLEKKEKLLKLWNPSNQHLNTFENSLTPKSLLQVPPRIAVIKSPSLTGDERMHHHPALLSELVTKTFLDTIGFASVSETIYTPELLSRVLEEEGYLNAIHLNNSKPVETNPNWDQLDSQVQLKQQQRELITEEKTENFKDPAIVYYLHQDFGEPVLSARVIFPKHIREGFKSESGRIMAGYLTIQNRQVQNRGGSLIAQNDLLIHSGNIYSETLKTRKPVSGGWKEVLQPQATFTSHTGSVNLLSDTSIHMVGTKIEAERDINFGAKQHILLESQQLQSHTENRVSKKTTVIDTSLTHEKSEVKTKGNININAGGTVIWRGVDFGGENLTTQAQEFRNECVKNEKGSTTISEKSGGLLSSKKKSTCVKTDQELNPNNLTPKKNLLIQTVGDMHLQFSKILCENANFESEEGNIFIELTKALHSISDTKSSKSTLWQSSLNEGHADEVSALMHLMAKGGGVEFKAKQVIVEVPIEVHSQDKNKGKFKVTHRGSKAQSLTKLECDPFTAWIKTLSNNPNVIWKGVEEEHKQWSHKSQGMTPAAQAILAVALSVVTGGVGGVLVGAAGTLTGMMASAAFTSLVSQATVSMINNQGNLSKVVKDLTTSQAMISTLTSMAGAGISHEFGLSNLNTKTFTDHLHNAGVQCIAPTTVSVLRNPNLKEALKQGLLDIGVAAVGSYGAKQIGGLYHPTDKNTPPISYIQHKFLHGILGAAMGTALSKDRALGALSGGFGAIASETIAEYITPSPEDLYNGIVDDHRKKGIVLTEEGLQKSYTKALQLRVDISRMTTATLLLLAKGDITVGDITGSNALQNNFSSTFASEFGKYAYQYGKDHPEEMEKLSQKISDVEEKIEETLSTDVEFFSHQKKNNLSRIDKNLNILSEENQQKYPLPNYGKETWAQMRKYQQDMRVIEENRTTTVGGLSGEVLLEGGLLLFPMGKVASGVKSGLKIGKDILIKTPYGKELINFSKPFVEKGIQLFQKPRKRVSSSVNNGGKSSVGEHILPPQTGPPPSNSNINVLDLAKSSKSPGVKGLNQESNYARAESIIQENSEILREMLQGVKKGEQPWTIRPGQEYKQKIIGKGQKTGTPGHSFTSYREAFKIAKREDVGVVTLDRGINRFLSKENKIKPNTRPDITYKTTDGKIHQIEVPSKTDKVPNLEKRMDDTSQRLPKEKRGNINVTHIKDNK